MRALPTSFARDDGWHFTIVLWFHRASDDVRALVAMQSVFSCALLTAWGRMNFGASLGASLSVFLLHVCAFDPMRIYSMH